MLHLRRNEFTFGIIQVENNIDEYFVHLVNFS